MTRVILLSLDGFPARRVSARLTPNLERLARSGVWAREGGRTGLPSSTYPSHASLLTGATLPEHGVVPARREDGEIVPPSERRVARPSILDRAAAAGLQVAAAVGDPKLVGVLGLGAHPVWPPVPQLPADLEPCEHGYIRDRDTLPHLLAAVASEAALVFGHLNEADTAGHVHGPDSEAAAETYRAVDRAVGEILAVLRDRWSETLLLVVSDHDMEEAAPAPPIELRDAATGDAANGVVRDVLADGGAAWAWVDGDSRAACERLETVHGVARTTVVEEGLILVAAAPGRRFAPTLDEPGFHGGVGSQRTLAIAGGGHPGLERVRAAVRAGAPPLHGWAAAIASALEIRSGPAPARRE